MHYKTTPMQHQIDEMAYCDQRYRGIFWDMGTGKTYMMLMLIAELFNKGKIDSVLIFAPKSMMHQWLDGEDSEWYKHCPLPLNKTAGYTWKNNRTKVNARDQENVLYPEKGILDVAVVNTEAVIGNYCQKFLGKYLRSHKATLTIVDEAAMIKNHRAKRSKVLKRVGKLSKYRRALTGTPVTNTPIDLYGIMSFINPEVFGHQFTLFRSQFAEVVEDYGPGGRKFPRIVGFKNLDMLRELVEPHSTRVLKEDVLDLPPVTFETIQCPLGKRQQEIYNKMVDEAIVELESLDGDTMEIACPSILSKLVRLQQIACGYLPVPESDKAIPIPDNTRYDCLLDFLELTDHKTIVFCSFRENVNDICRRVGERFGKDSFVRYTGATKDRSGAQRQFRTDPKCRFFIGTTATGNLGLNLVEATTMVFFSNNFNLGQRLQAQDRCYRKGQEKPVTIYDIVAPDTIDMKVRNALVSKRKLADCLIDGRILEWLKELQ